MLHRVLAATSFVVLIGCKTIEVGIHQEDQEVQTIVVTTDPNEAKIFTSDIDNFWRAYNEATPQNDSIVYRDFYLERGSPGLKGFSKLKIANPTYLAIRVENRAKYYASIRSSTLAIRTKEEKIRESFMKLKELYPDAVFPDVYFLIGPMNAGGIATEQGLVIGAEIFSKAPSSPLDELNAWEANAVKPAEKIPGVVVHELVHFQQRTLSSAGTLLAWSIGEGIADFLAELIAGCRINELQHEYGDRHEAELWQEFKQVMNGKDLSMWLYNGGKVPSSGKPGERPADLGNYFGHRICQAYYERASDKKQAIKDMLEVRDFAGFLAASGYERILAARYKSAVEPTGSLTSQGRH